MNTKLKSHGLWLAVVVGLMCGAYVAGYEASRRSRGAAAHQGYIPRSVQVSTPPGPSGAGKYQSLTVFRYCFPDGDPMEVCPAQGAVWRMRVDGGLTLYLCETQP